MAGAATAVEAASPTPADFRNSRRFIGVSPGYESTLCRRDRSGVEAPFLLGQSPASDWAQSYETIGGCQTKKPGATTPGLPILRRRTRSGARARPDHEGVVGVFGDLPPEIFVVAEGDDRVPDLLVIGVCRRRLGVDFIRGFQARFHHRLRERTKLRAVG